MTTQRANPFTSILRPHSEIIEGKVEEALRLADIYIYNELKDRVQEVVEVRKSPLLNPIEFLKRTHFSDSMKKVLLKVMGGLAAIANVYVDERGGVESVGSRVIVIPSHLGGGKTHLLATLYYIARLFNEKGVEVIGLFEDKRVAHGLRHACSVLAEHGKVKIIAIVGDTRLLSPNPEDPVIIDGVKIHTPWGLLGYLLGMYEEVRKADENHYAPPVDVLMKLLRGKRVLILIDEAVEYMVVAVRLDSKYKGYSEAYLSFIRNLAEAVNGMPGAVLVITIPAEYREGTVAPSHQHPEYVQKIVAMLSRVAPEFISPLEFRKDIIDVFKKRIFENAYTTQVKQHAEIVASILDQKVQRDSSFEESVKAKYGSQMDFKGKVKDSYPFHPYYVELIANIAMRNPELGLTRQLLAYTARLIRQIYTSKMRSGRDPPVALIVPWLIPLEQQEFRADLLKGFLSQVQADFIRIYEQDVMRYSATLEYLLHMDQRSREEIAKLVKAIVTRTIWLSTIPGGGGKGAEALKLYVFRKHYPVIVFDPIALRDVMAADILNAIEELRNESTYLAISEDDRVFYALIPDILLMLRQRYLEATDFHALSKLEKFINIHAFRPGRRIKKILPIITSRIKEIEELVENEVISLQSPLLVVYFGLQDPPPELPDIVLKRNNIVLLLPNYSANPLELGLRYTDRFRRILGDEPPITREFIKNIAKLLSIISDLRSEKDYLKSIVGEDYLGHVINQLKEMEEELERLLTNAIYSVLKKAIIGLQRVGHEVDLRPIGEGEGVDLSNLARLLEEILNKRGVITTWEWTTVHSQLRNWDVWDVDRSLIKPIRIGEIWNQLLYSPGVRPHLTSFDDFLEALKSAYRLNILAFKSDSYILWLKHPYTLEEAKKLVNEKISQGETLHDWERDVEQYVIRQGTKVVDLEAVSPRVIIRQYIEQVKQRVAFKPGERVVRRLLIYTSEGLKDLDFVIALCKSDSELVETLSRYPITIMEEKPPYIFYIKPIKVNEKPFAETPVELEGDERLIVKVNGVVETPDKPQQVDVVIELKDSKGVHVDEKRTIAKPGVPFTLEYSLSQPGEYIVILRGESREERGYKTPEKVIAKVKIRGVVCKEDTFRVLELKSRLEKIDPATELELKQLSLEAVVKRHIIPQLVQLLSEVSKHRARANGTIIVKTGEEEFKLEFTNANPGKLTELLVAVKATDAELVNIKLILLKLDMRALTSSPLLRGLLLDAFSPLSTIAFAVVKECRRM